MFLNGNRYTVIARSTITHIFKPYIRVNNITNRIPLVFSDTTYLCCLSLSKSFRSILTGFGPGSLGNLWSSMARSFIVRIISSRESPVTLCSCSCNPFRDRVACSVEILILCILI
ncbi:hypothetical protein NY2A_b147L [Paramecium bursaria Chlorella virus NY2A]|uniref:Uncharacterized protein b147L n=1 Tax=Paramecium bursaria Chlorella virus NY2A TaxID=46021 RepID=A7IW22_PBCVN|nr:hypothetical protein NY2A_b147L [Paramecium bursaria Chlorella virus NY2A]ABT14546.1 hypothetical protein NY2A_b147L [Paramecium bursaria Chlorella virus NY2A]